MCATQNDGKISVRLSRPWTVRPTRMARRFRVACRAAARGTVQFPRSSILIYIALAALDPMDAATVAGSLAGETPPEKLGALAGKNNDEYRRCDTQSTKSQLPTDLDAGPGGGSRARHRRVYTCGAAGGACTCVDGASSSQFVYVWGDVDIRFPDPSVMVELETMAVTLNIHKAGPDKSPRNWYLRVLQQPEARYIAREVSWILKVQGQPAYYLCLRDLSDLDNLIECLGSPEEYGYNYFNDLRVFVGRSLLVPIETCPGICAPVLLVTNCLLSKPNQCMDISKMPLKRRIGEL